MPLRQVSYCSNLLIKSISYDQIMKLVLDTTILKQMNAAIDADWTDEFMILESSQLSSDFPFMVTCTYIPVS